MKYETVDQCEGMVVDDEDQTEMLTKSHQLITLPHKYYYLDIQM